MTTRIPTLEKWDLLRSTPYYFFYYYVPLRYQMASLESQYIREEI